jgi:hypothetical protein
MKVETVHVATRNPRNDEDPGECAIVHFVVENNVVNVTDKDGHMLRYPDGEPCRRALELGDDPRQIAARLGRSYHSEYGGRAFWGDISRINGKASPV